MARRFFPGILLVLIGTAAYFQAVGAGHVVAAAVLSEPEVPPPTGARVAVTMPEDPRARSAAAIIARNPFDSVTGPLDGTTVNPPPPPEEEVALNQDPYADPFCEGTKVLAIVASEEEAWSFATLAGASGPSVLRRQGDAVDGRTVAFVGDWRSEDRRREDRRAVWDRVWLTDGKTRCQVQLGHEVQAAAPKPQKAAPTAGDKNKLPPDIVAGIRRISATEIEVERSALDRILERQAELFKVRIVPEKEGDRVTGARVFGVKSGTLLHMLGVENGDLLRSVNGLSMTDPQSALALYARLPTMSQFAVAIERKGKPMQVDVRVK